MLNIEFSPQLLAWPLMASVLAFVANAQASEAVASEQAPAASEVDVADVQARVAALIAKTKANLIFVKGGKFKMGDFGPVHSKEKLPYTGQPSAMPLHDVELDSFSMGRYKVTYEDFDVFTDATGRDRIATKDIFERGFRAVPLVPAGVSWFQADDYCKWLRQRTGQPFDLPTEAQYEYAARSRGRFILWPTDNGQYDEGRNVASNAQAKQMMTVPNFHPTALVYPIGRFAPSSMGFYDMGANGWDWLKDWFNEDYYLHSPRKNPQGPASGAEKSQRGVDGGAAYTALTMYRHKHAPEGEVNVSSGFRCVVNSQQSGGNNHVH